MIKGNQREDKSFSSIKKVGFVKFNKIVSFNPKTNEEKKKLGAYVKDEELAGYPEYTGEKNGVNYSILDFYLQEENSSFIYQKRFYIRNEISKSKEESTFNERGEPKVQYINNVGKQEWAYNEQGLSTWFKECDFHPAKGGEADLISFLKTLCNLDYKAEITYDWKKILDGDFKDLEEDVKAMATDIILPLEVELKITDNGVKEIQANYDKFLPGFYMKYINNKKSWSQKDIDTIRENIEYNKKVSEKIKTGVPGVTKNDKKKVTDLEYAIAEIDKKSQNCYYIGMAKEFKKEDYEQAGECTLVDDEFDAVPVSGNEEELDY